jgi:hypothetical protein
MYGRTWDWYTVEGPFVVKRQGRYYLFFSGGAWRQPGEAAELADGVLDGDLGLGVEGGVDRRRHLDDDVAVVVRVARQKQHAQLLLGARAPLFQLFNMFQKPMRTATTWM